MTTVKNVPAKLYYKQKYVQYKQLLDTKLRRDVSQGLYSNVIQDYHTGCTKGELCTKYNLSYLKLKIILRNEYCLKIPSADVADIKLRLQNKLTTKKEVMSQYKISYRTLNYLLSEPTEFTVSGVANDSISCQFGTVCCAQHLTSLTNWKTWRKVSENSATKKHIQCTFIEKEYLGFLWFEIILYKQRLIELFGSYVQSLKEYMAHDIACFTFQVQQAGKRHKKKHHTQGQNGSASKQIAGSKHSVCVGVGMEDFL
ncbi:hypothetical protein PROFUN_16833, partial [Planoprotostelium fungivorum]